MARKRQGRPVHGWVVVDKPLGVTSVNVVAAVRRGCDAAKAGHSGTLDPLATGVLPIALGEATKTISFVMDCKKSYRFTVRWGERRDTDDAEGRVIEESGVRPDTDAIRAVSARFVGEIDQVPPQYSAVKVEGKRAYELARARLDVDLKARPAYVERFDLVACPDIDHAVFDVVCGKGTYMRALARDIAIALGTCGYVSALRRTSVGSFKEADAIPLEKVESLGHSGALLDHVLPIEAVLADIPALALTEAEARKMQHGQPVPVLPVARRMPEKLVLRDAVVCAMAEGKPVALARVRGGEIRPVRVLNL
ncbi:MAG: tRNA pseudouridine(55) synthase TruB [Rhodospirillales bacterium]|nr:tRNA pseudouridine(55) synthase TruB [Rhodospirillales bacterium]